MTVEVKPVKEISLIAAMTAGGVIGKGNNLPWSIPEDLKLFKKITMGNILIMGRKTYESIGKPLPGRKNFIITSSAAEFSAPESSAQENSSPARIYENGKPYYFASFLDAASAASSAEGNSFIIGGGSIYTHTLPYADRMYLSMVKKEYDGDVYFPRFDLDEWVLSEEKDFGNFVLKVLLRI